MIGFVRDKRLEDGVYPALAALMRDIADQVRGYGSLAAVPVDRVGNTRNGMYLTSEALRTLPKVHDSQFSPEDGKVLARHKSSLDTSTKFIPTWVKIVVALALVLGTMIGWKRIVVTMGEKIGKTHLNYGQGASAELVAMATILAADQYRLPVSTTHVLSSGVAGTMAANGSACRRRPSATSSWPGCRRCPVRSCRRARSTSSSAASSDRRPCRLARSGFAGSRAF